MSTLSEQFSEATKESIDAQLAIFSAFTNSAIESLEKVVELNLAVAKTSLEESNTAVKQLISAKDAQEFFNLAASHGQPTTDKALTYTRHLASITSNAQSELAKVAETHVTDTNRKVIAFFEELFKNAPAGSENTISLFKSAIGNAIGTASASYEQLNKSTKQAVETLEANLNTAANQISHATKSAQRATKKSS